MVANPVARLSRSSSASGEDSDHQRSRFRATNALVNLLSAFTAAIAAVFTTVFLLAPNLGSATSNAAAINNVVVEPEVSLGSYLRDAPVVLSLERNRTAREAVDRFVGAHTGELSDLGSVVDFEYQVVGYRGRSISARWTAFDGQTGQRIQRSEDYDLLPLKFVPEKKSGDVGSWEIWVSSKINAGRSIFLLIELYDLAARTRLCYAETDKFTLPS